jgi:acyl-homoserine-lactone acylase
MQSKGLTCHFAVSAMLWALVAGAAPAREVKTDILWDRWGVPHVYAPNERAAIRAYGWAQAKSHLNLLLRFYGEGRGRGAEYWGESALALDRWLRTLDAPRRARRSYAAQRPEIRGLLDAFASGVNAYARVHPEAVADANRPVLPITGVDVLAHIQRVIDIEFRGIRFMVGATEKALQGGSNAWAVAPSRSASGHALLLASPHLPWGSVGLFFEAHLVAPGLEIYGATIVGCPLPVIGFNQRLGWTHTLSREDSVDLYTLTLDGTGYRWNGATRPFGERREPIKVKRADGTVGTEVLTVRSSIHGPVVLQKDNQAIAVRIAGFDEGRIVEQYRDMARATNLQEFTGALRKMQIPRFTTLYADQAGHIMYFFGGQTPVRPSGEWSWSGIVPGDTSATLWNRLHKFQELPRLVDPPTAWLQSANDSPWTATLPLALNPRDFPPYLAPVGLELKNAFRVQRSLGMLRSDESISLEEMAEDAQSSRLELADRLLDDLLPLAKASGKPLLLEAAKVLEQWDRQAEAQSRGAVLFHAFYRELRELSAGKSPFAVPWSEAAPDTTPDGLADPALAVQALERASQSVRKAHQALDVPWGDVHRLLGPGVDLPASGGPEELGCFRTVEFVPVGNHRFAAAGGESFIAAVEFGKPVRALARLPYGNATEKGSAHINDQFQLFAEKRLRPVWLDRADVEGNLEAREEL